MNGRTAIRWLLGIAISAVFLWLAFRTINAGEVWNTIITADQRYLIPTTLFTTLSFLLRGLRWQLCFAPEDRVTYGEASAAYGAGVASSQVIPARLGDLVRAYVLGQVSGVSKSKALGTIVIERLSDLFVVVTMLALLLPLFSLPSWIKVFDGFAAAIAVVTLVVVYFLAQRGENLQPPAWVVSRRPLELAFGILVQILAGFSAVRDVRRALLILLVSAAVWVTQTGTYAVSFQAVHISLGWKEGALMTGVLALTAIIPTGPGFAGSFEIAAQNLLALFSVDKTLATGYLEYTRIPSLLGVVIFAIIGFVFLRLSPRRMKAEPSVPANEAARLRSTQ